MVKVKSSEKKKGQLSFWLCDSQAFPNDSILKTVGWPAVELARGWGGGFQRGEGGVEGETAALSWALSSQSASLCVCFERE